MSLDSLPDLRCLMMMDGTLFGQVEDAASLAPMELCQGGDIAPFEPCDSSPEAPATQPRYPFDCTDLAQRTTSRPAEESPGQVFACWCNHLPDWSLEGAETIQLMIHRQEDPCDVFFDSAIEVPEVTPGLAFTALLGAHRARARLQVRFEDTLTGERQAARFEFDRGHPGGRQRGGYLEVRHPLPAHFRACRVTLAVEYLGPEGGEPGAEPFLFLADVAVTGEKPEAPSARLLSPEWIIGGTAEQPGDWIRARLPAALGPGQDIALRLGSQTYPVTPMAPPDFRVRENYGHTLVCASSHAMALILYIDGAPARRLQVVAGDTIVRVPGRYLTGQVRRLSLRDPSGTVTLFEEDRLVPAIVTPDAVMQRESVAPYPTTLFAQTPLRYAALKAHLAAGGDGLEPTMLAHALETLEGGPEKVRLAPLSFPEVMAPDVSVVIPAHNGLHLTYLALCALLLAHNEASFEVILVDDGSSDETAAIEALVSGITVVRHETPQRFLRACNAGAARARGDYIALLNNDTEVTVGWLDALIDAFDRFENVGLVGAKLLYPDGRLQEAGGIVWGSGNPWNYGKGENASDPRFCYARQADYLSGAALMMPRRVWEEVGGLSAEFEPMYFEDTDLAFKVRAAGYSTWYIPGAQVYHFEGGTSGTDVGSGFKRFQEVNRPKFKRRWAAAFAQHAPEGRDPDLEKDRGICGRVLFIDHAPPRADKDAGSYAALQEMRLVQSLGFKVTFVSTNMAHLGRYTERLQRDGIEVIHAPFYMNVSEYLDRHAPEFDAFYITRYYVAQAVLRQIRSLAPDARIIFNNADLHFLRELRGARSAGDATQLEKARQTRHEEMEMIEAADLVLSYTEVEHAVIQASTDGAAQVLRCPWVVETVAEMPPLEGRQGLSFLGSFRHFPNTEGISWFARTVMPRLAIDAPEIELSIYGSAMGEKIRRLAAANVHPHGFVEETEEAFDRHRIFVAPLLSGAGIKGKVLAALARGVPCILSPIAAEGIGLRNGHDCLIVERAQEWVEAIRLLHVDDTLWHSLSSNALAYLRENYSFEAGRAQMRRALEAVDLYAARP